MRFSFVIFLLCSLAGLTRAAEDPARSQIQAATRDAVANLIDEVSRIPITRAVTVGDLVQRTNSADELRKVLQRAQQLGGPRWIDDKTCQIELQISGPVVAQALKRAAAANPKQSPLSVGEVTRAVKDWDERSFSATGTATSNLPVAKIRRAPRMGLQRDPWWDVNDAARDQAVATAKADAARRSLGSLRPIELTAKSSVGDVLAVRDVNDGMQKWFSLQPAARVELHDDMEVEVELSATPADTFQTFRGLASKQSDVPLPADDAAWAKVRNAFERMNAPVGRSVVPRGGNGGGAGAGNIPGAVGLVPVVAAKPLNLPARAPAWVRQRLEATGNGAPGKSKLMAARAAEAAAEDKLRKQIDDLQLTPKLTMAQAAKDDPRIEQAVRRALNQTRIGKADYHDNGAADVAVYLDLDALWQELRVAE